MSVQKRINPSWVTVWRSAALGRAGNAGVAAHHKTGGAKMHRVRSTVSRPIGGQFHVASQRKRSTTLEADAARTHVVYRARNPTCTGSLAGQAELNAERQFKSSPYAPFDVLMHFHISSPPPSTAAVEGRVQM